MSDVWSAIRLWLATAFRAAPLLVAAQCLFVIAQSIIPPIQTFGIKLLVDGITTNSGTTIAWGIGVILAGFAVIFAGNLMSGPVQSTTAEKVFNRIYEGVLETTASVPGIAHHEHPGTANRVEYIRENSWKLGISFEILLFGIGTLANTVVVLSLLGAVHPVLLLLPLLSSARIWSAAQRMRWQNDADEATLPHARMVDRLLGMSKDSRHGLELRIFGLQNDLVRRLIAAQDTRAAAENHAAVRGTRLDTVVRLGFALAYAAAIVWAFNRARAGWLSPGDIALLILLAPQVDQLAGGIAGNVYSLGDVLRTYMRYDWLRRYARRHAWADSTGSPPVRLRSGIELVNVDFAYPGGSDADEPTAANEAKRVLTGISLVLPAGSTVALVGDNAAGKTTLVKMLARMYDPTAGAILVDGADLRTIHPTAWRSRVSAGFQDFVKFEFLAREAVGIGDLPRLEDEPSIRGALTYADAEQLGDELPNGIGTQLGTRFSGGHDLSGGQWQRIALARAFMRQRPLLLLLDEPTAALDPEAEHALFKRFAAASKHASTQTGGITILVSHRFSTVRMADRIVVLDRGRIAEIGTHEELLAAGGRYAELFAMQARAYQ